METDRVFLDPGLSKPATAVEGSVGVLTYLVNSISKGDSSTPYSFAVACGPSSDHSLSLVPEAMGDGEVIINEWLSRRIDARAGDRITVSYYELEAGGGFIEREREFTVLRVASMDEFATERKLMPDFPGLTDVDQCSDWDVGMPMKEDALRDEDNQDYWNRYRATPKMIVTLNAGREMWANRFGDTTAVRFPLSIPGLDRQLSEKIGPESVGLIPLPVREQALRAVSQAMSFGELFASMSFFLILSALLLTAMLFIFGVQQRAEEMGLLLGVGFLPGQVRSLFLMEGGLVALAGSLTGGLLGTYYTRMLIWGLAGHWKGAVAGASIQYYAEAGTLSEGILSSFMCALIAMAIVMWRQAKQPARALLSGDFTQGGPSRATAKSCRRTFAVSALAAVLAAATAAYAIYAGQQDTVYAFFGAGFLLLLAGLGFSRLTLQQTELRSGSSLTLSALGARNASRRSGRSLTAVVLIGCGCFLVFAVSAMQQDLAGTAREKWSGTGGFELFAESTLPLPDQLESGKAGKEYRLDSDRALNGASFISMKVRDGDDASCFNLNRAQAPRLLGIDPSRFQEAGAFLKDTGADSFWRLLAEDLPEGVIPGLAGDANTAMWNLQKKVGPKDGDEIIYRDERGETFKVKLVGTIPVPLSVFQGTILIARSDFERYYPSESGYRMFLVDLPANANSTDAADAITQRLDRMGIDVQPALSRLLEFHGVESTYLNMFLVLGGLGVILGTFGLGVVVLRNMMERRAEFALLRCVGFSRGRIVWLVLSEHWMLLGLGLVCGLVSAAVSIYPSLAAPGMHVPLGPIALLLAAILIAGLASTVAAVLISLRGDLIPALRSE